ncbi:hypothetical protein RFI_17254, partial [Reticulomyxa filosa]
LEWHPTKKFFGAAFYVLQLEYPTRGTGRRTTTTTMRPERLVLGITTDSLIQLDWKQLYAFCERYQIDLHSMNNEQYPLRLSVQTVTIERNKQLWSCSKESTPVKVRFYKLSPAINPSLTFKYFAPEDCAKRKNKYIFQFQ